jgi:NAD(P)-dependent dehydrogenase (short-subunit alcohol dehydrogenase family)
MMGILEGKVAVITGGTRGLGLAIARAYAEEGAAVVVASRSPAAVEEAVTSLRAAGARASGWPCDVGDLVQVEALAASAVQTLGPLHIWVNNAAVPGPYGPTAHIPPEEFARVLRTNIFGVYHGALMAMQHFVPRGSGKLINILGMGSRQPTPLQNAYASSKAWVRSFTLALAKEYEDSGVSVFALNPGLMRTDLLQKVEAVSGYEGRLKPLETVIRMWANPPEVPTRKAVWLASADTDGRTGLEIKVLTPTHLLRGLLREGWRRLMRRPAPPVELAVGTVPSALSTPPTGRD